MAKTAVLAKSLAYPKFASKPYRALVFAADYHLVAESLGALSRLGVQTRRLPVDSASGRGQEGFIEALLAELVLFKPDFVFCINYLGFDREGRLSALLADLGLPVAVWFVDHPSYILEGEGRQCSSLVQAATWDRDTLASLEQMGFEHSIFLPLATDTARFRPGRSLRADVPRPQGVSFVGSSMLGAVQDAATELEELWPGSSRRIKTLAAAYGQSDERNALHFLAGELGPDFDQASNRARNAAQKLLAWEATRLHRGAVVKAMLPLSPVIAGDARWQEELGPPGAQWVYAGKLGYYRDLPGFFGLSPVSLNTTSAQMKGAANQRVFDVPACGGVLVTDAREQLDELFDSGAELACYESSEQALELVARYLKDVQAAARLAAAAKARIEAQHTYVHRLGRLLEVLAQRFSGYLKV